MSISACYSKSDLFLCQCDPDEPNETILLTNLTILSQIACIAVKHQFQFQQEVDNMENHSGDSFSHLHVHRSLEILCNNL